MRITPEELGIDRADLIATRAWWRSLSVNQMKAVEEKHHWPAYGSWVRTHYLWKLEGKPEPQEVIPVAPAWR